MLAIRNFVLRAIQRSSLLVAPVSSVQPALCAAFPFHSSAACFRRKDRSSLTRDLPPDDEGVDGEKSVVVGQNFGPRFPTLETHNSYFDGILYTDLPIVFIKCSQNNTIMSIEDPRILPKPNVHKGLALVSCGTEGFRNCKKGTNVAGQAVGLTLGRKAIGFGLKTVRVCIKGLGPGRASSIKGLEMAGVSIVSITDNTPIPDNGNKPRKARRV